MESKTLVPISTALSARLGLGSAADCVPSPSFSLHGPDESADANNRQHSTLSLRASKTSLLMHAPPEARVSWTYSTLSLSELARISASLVRSLSFADAAVFAAVVLLMATSRESVISGIMARRASTYDVAPMFARRIYSR